MRYNKPSAFLKRVQVRLNVYIIIHIMRSMYVQITDEICLGRWKKMRELYIYTGQAYKEKYREKNSFEHSPSSAAIIFCMHLRESSSAVYTSYYV